MKRNACKYIIFCGLILMLSAASGKAWASKYNVAILKCQGDGNNVGIAENLMSALSANGFAVDFITYENICSENGLKKYDCLILTDSTGFAAMGQENLLKSLKHGTDMVLMGGMAFREQLWKVGDKWLTEKPTGEENVKPLDLPVFEDRSIYYFRDEPVLATYEKQDILKSKLKITGKYTGISAIAFEYPEVSRYVPLLSVEDKYSRNVGFACGLLVNYAGEFKNSNWLLFGIEDSGFYCSEEFVKTTIEVLNKIKGKDLARQFKKEDSDNEKRCLEIVSKAPERFIRLSKDQKHFLLPDGKKFFALGCNYIGPFERKCEYGEDYFSSKRLEDDFKKAKDAGINAFRFWHFRIAKNPKRLKTIIELARKYEIYLLLHPRAHPLSTDKKLMQVFERNAAIVNDETIVLGYDLMNEPYITTVGSVSIDGGQTEILKHKVYERYCEKYFDKKWVEYIANESGGWPELGEWIKGKDRKDIYAAHSMFKKYIEKYNRPEDYSCLYGLDGELPIEDDYRDFIGAVEETFRDWIVFHKEAIRKFGDNHFITVGYNTSLAALAANELLDFASHHIYQLPYSYQDVQKAVTTFDRLRKFWPNKPITLGEFGFTSGMKLTEDTYLGHHCASVAEMIVYLYAFAHDYSGCYLWTLSEWPIANMKYNAPWISEDRHKYESRFGLYSYDGSEQGRAKPMAHATKFFREYIDRHESGDGSLEIVQAETPIKTGYVFTDDDALFVGNVKYDSKGLKFQSKLPVNVMVMWDSRHLQVMATGDVEVEINLSEFGFSDDSEFEPDGLYGEFIKTGNVIKLKLLEGQIVNFQ